MSDHFARRPVDVERAPPAAVCRRSGQTEVSCLCRRCLHLPSSENNPDPILPYPPHLLPNMHSAQNFAKRTITRTCDHLLDAESFRVCFLPPASHLPHGDNVVRYVVRFFPSPLCPMFPWCAYFRSCPSLFHHRSPKSRRRRSSRQDA